MLNKEELLKFGWNSGVVPPGAEVEDAPTNIMTMTVFMTVPSFQTVDWGKLLEDQRTLFNQVGVRSAMAILASPILPVPSTLNQLMVPPPPPGPPPPLSGFASPPPGSPPLSSRFTNPPPESALPFTLASHPQDSPCSNASRNMQLVEESRDPVLLPPIVPNLETYIEVEEDPVLLPPIVPNLETYIQMQSQKAQVSTPEAESTEASTTACSRSLQNVPPVAHVDEKLETNPEENSTSVEFRYKKYPFRYRQWPADSSNCGDTKRVSTNSDNRHWHSGSLRSGRSNNRHGLNKSYNRDWQTKSYRNNTRQGSSYSKFRNWHTGYTTSTKSGPFSRTTQNNQRQSPGERNTPARYPSSLRHGWHLKHHEDNYML